NALIVRLVRSKRPTDDHRRGAKFGRLLCKGFAPSERGCAGAGSLVFSHDVRRASLPYKRTPIPIFLVLALSCLTSTASQVDLVPGTPRHGSIAAGKSQCYVFSLTAGDFVQVRIETRGAGILKVYGPSASKVRGFYVGKENANVGFVVEATGPHRIEIAP